MFLLNRKGATTLTVSASNSQSMSSKKGTKLVLHESLKESSDETTACSGSSSSDSSTWSELPVSRGERRMTVTVNSRNGNINNKSTGLANSSSNSNSSPRSRIMKRRRQVTFGNVHLVHLAMMHGEHPGCRDGPAVCLSSEELSTNTLSVEEHVYIKFHRGTRSRSELYIPSHDRRRITSSDGQSSHDSTSSAESTAVSESNLTVSPTSHFRGSLKLCTPNPLRRTAADSIKARRAMQEAIQLPSLLHDDDVHVADENNDKHNDDNCKKGDNKDGKENEKDCETEKNDHLPTTTRVSSKQKRAKEVQKLLALVDVQDPKLKHAMERLSRKLEQEVIHKLERDIRASNHFC